MRYKLKFTPISWKAWQKLDKTIQTQLKKKLKERLQNPHVPADTSHIIRNQLVRSSYRFA